MASRVEFLAAVFVLLQLASHALSQINSNEPPFFDDDEMVFSVFEDHNKSLLILADNFAAFDPEGDPIAYSIPENALGSDTFTLVNYMDGFNLYFMEDTVLNREAVSEYKVIVEATDNINHGDVNPDSITIIVELEDINDETPRIINLPYTEKVSEDLNPSSLVFDVNAVDNDEGKNGRIKYTITSVTPASGTDKFLMFISSGEIRLQSTLDYENTTEYEIIVVASDYGDQPLSSVGILNIKVLDANDNDPEFLQVQYAQQIREDLEVGSDVLQVQAVDKDVMLNYDIIYSIDSISPNSDLFRIDNVTGWVYVNGELEADFGSPEIYTITIRAEEVPDPTKFTTTTAVITVLDVNDHPPMFEEASYNGTLSESTHIGTTAVTVKATDEDQGSNAQFSFHLENLLLTPLPFNVTQSSDGESGHIQLTDELDFEMTTEYKFEVIATEIVDNRTKTASTVVTITIININDNFPLFDKKEYTADVSENANINDYVGQVNAVDADEGSFGDVYYYLINHQDVFEITETTGIITLKRKVDYEVEMSFALTVAANDSASSLSDQLKSQVQVHVSVLDVNDNGPVISANGSNEVTVQVEEEQGAGVLVYVIEADDADDSPNDILDYFVKIVEPKDADAHFEFSSEAKNQLITSSPLDYEEVKQYRLETCVTDLGGEIGSLEGSGSGLYIKYQTVYDLPQDHRDCIHVIVNVIDENDNPPVFEGGASSYSFSVYEEQVANTPVGVVNATDVDSGLFGMVEYSLSGVDHDNFTIDSMSGAIVTAGPIDREVKDRFDLVVTASDLDTDNSQSSTAALTITILDVNDNVPMFSQPVYVENDIVENTQKVAIQVTASDRDIGNNMIITYTIVEGNSDNQFVIDSDTGLISKNPSVVLDREMNPEFELIIEAEDGGQPNALASNTTVFIEVQDQNDEEPVFDKNIYYVNVTEGASIGSQILTVFADDKDYEANGQVLYSFDTTDSDSQYFMINSESGIITTNKNFDYDTEKEKYTFDVIANDKGVVSKSAQATIEVTILDANDNAPQFTKIQYSKSISESANSGSSITTVRATDQDNGVNEMITYTILNVTAIGEVVQTEAQAHNTIGLFTLDENNGKLQLSTNRRFDYESVTGYIVQVEARDGGMPSKTDLSIVQVSILDFNDNPPVLSEEVYSLVIEEDEDIKSTYDIFSYTDADSGSNALATYSINTNVFSIDASTGILTLESSLNYETMDYFEFEVTVTNTGSSSMKDTSTVNVTVVDANDNSPIFQMPPFPKSANINIREMNYTAPFSEMIYTFYATDSDDALNGEVDYTITNGDDNSLFTINEVTGELWVVGIIDRETEDNYELTITATDGGVPSRSATATISITIMDINEEPPYFIADSYSYTIAENNMVGVSLVTVEADDQDSGINAEITFSVNDTTNFKITSDGVIEANQSFNYEDVQFLNVLVTATDGGGMYSTTYFSLTITDVNDNKPDFQNTFNTPFEVSENEAEGFFLASAKATDDDSGANGDVTYQMAGAQGKFAIDSDGLITLQSSLDRETNAFYTLVVTAFDHGFPNPMSATNEINVTVTDVNDNVPKFDSTFYSINVPENESLLATVESVSASDEDAEKNAELSFAIIDGNSDNKFAITTSYNSTNDKYIGNIKIASPLDYETETSYSLQILASDMGTGQVQSSTAFVSINVININDEAPVFSPSDSYSFSISEIAISGTPVGTVYATDNDVGSFGKISSYTFAPDTSSNVTMNFELSQLNGVITLSSSSNLDYDSNSQSYTFSVVASDGGDRSSTASVVVNILDHNEDAPSFDSQTYTGSVKENLGMDQLITTVHATDPDNLQVSYSITEGNDNGHFKIDNSGSIRTTGALNREDKEVYVLTVSASDSAVNPLYGFAQVEITILDENDNSPVFSSTLAEYQISENAIDDTDLAPLAAASDADKGNNSKITYTASGEGVPNVFTVDPLVGTIQLVGQLNFEIKEKYTFIVFAEDGGVVPKSSNITIVINVLDFNDNEPEFNKSFYTASISESITEQSVVLTVFATDIDAGSNAEIIYSINETDTFEINKKGEILTKINLDYETNSVYVLTVIASDNGSPKKSDSATVQLTIEDANDETPKFDQSSYSIEIKEQNIQTDLFLIAVVAIDNDGTSPNNEVTYNIASGNDNSKFKIDSNGDLIAIKTLDYEETESYTLIVTATDNPQNASEARFNQTQVTIIIQDVNDNSPVWVENDYTTATNQFSGSIIESAEKDELVLYVEASDADSGAFGSVTYSFETASSYFYINATFGFVYTFGGLDVETTDFYNLTIIAEDGDGRKTKGYLNIVIKDINDRQPSFTSSFFYKEVKEDYNVAMVLITLQAFDIDSENLEFSIIEGNSLGFFKINSSSGAVGLAKPLDRETEDDFLLRVFVDDGEFNDTTNLRIVVKDVNDNPPKFIDAPYFAYIDENTVSGTFLLKNMNGNDTFVLAEDPDQDETPNSIVVYRMAGPNADVLNVNPSNGVLTVASGANLDYETNTEIVVTIVAQDSVDPPGIMSSSTTITIYVQDVNDNNPEFDRTGYSATVTENFGAGTVVIPEVAIVAEDEDTVGNEISYSIENSNPATNLDDFIINSTTAEVTLKNPLDREETHQIVLTIRASDGGPVVKTAEVLLTVTVLDVNDNAPVFNASSYVKFVPENIGASEYITTVLATDDDDNNNGDVEYFLLTYDDVFLINKGTGDITTIINLDHEVASQYSIIVQACDRATTPLCSNSTVVVQVTDINDIYPEFDYDNYYTIVCIDEAPVTNVMRVIALDGDSGDNGKVQYTLASGDDLGPFTLNVNTGDIVLMNAIPQSIGTITVTIIATDGGDVPKTGETEVEISFCDKDTDVIFFNQSAYYGAVKENEIPPIHVASVTAVSNNMPITYSILPPKTVNHFNITQAGGINTAEMLDREERAAYTLIVKVVDNATTPNTAYSTVLVTILDENDNPPEFLLLPYSFVLTEELENTTVVDKVAATDPDQPFNPEGITYSIDSASNPDGVFKIDANGTIYATKPVDRETTPQFTLKIKASDTDPTDPRIKTAKATITILDVNDNPPVFNPAKYETPVSENNPSNKFILQVSATDDDLDLNREIVYSIESGGANTFFIDSTTGVLKTLTLLDYESQTFYNVTVKAQDKGNPPMSSFTSVLITVDDYNDNKPIFTDASYEASLDEDRTPGPVLNILATDDDSGLNKEITYTIITGNDDNRFGLNSSTGELYLEKSLDFETTTFYNLHVQAIDNGTPAMSALTNVLIGVKDVNDQDPEFIQSEYTQSLAEDRNVGLEIIVVSAIDLDGSDDNSALTYSLLSGNTNGDFEIDPESGSVKIKNELDRETTPSYSIVIGVQDSGAIPRYDNATLLITITDVNDNAPVISNVISGATFLDVFENATSSNVLFTVNASDKDSGNNARLQFSLQNYEDVFTIQSLTGEIKLIAELDYDGSDKEYELSIEVADSASDALSDQATLSVLVKDINDNDPIFMESLYTATRPEEEAVGQVFTTVQATDLDGTIANNKITYQLTDCSPKPLCQNSFTVNGSTGEVTNLQKLNREENDDQFTLTITGVNLGADPERQDTTTVVIHLTDINDHSPQFTEKVYSIPINEGTEPNTPLLTVDSTDSDQPNTMNSQVSYKIASVISNNPFSLNEDTGLLEVTGTIDRESVAFYNFTIRAEDNGEPQLYDDVQVMITVGDENDQPPVFVTNTMSVRVNEMITESSLPYSLWTPTYDDNDELDENKASTYAIVNVVENSNSLGSDTSLISINETSGEVFLTSLVDYETTQSLTVVVSVNNTKVGTGSLCGGFDSTCSLSDTATLTVEITDSNDNSPIFEKTSYSGQISTSAVPGTQVRQLVAIDKDSQNNFGEVRYRLGAATSTKFSVEEETGWVFSRGTFENDDGRSFTIEIEAYDNLGNDPSHSATVEMTILALSGFRRVVILFNKEPTAFTEEKEKLIVDLLHNQTGYTIVVEDIREHLLDNGEADSTKTDFIFHAINTNGKIVEFDELLDNLDLNRFFDAIAECEPLQISALQSEEVLPKIESLMLFLIILCGILVIGSIIVLVLACQQRYIALNMLWKSRMRDAFYGTSDPSIIDGAVPKELMGDSFEMRGRTTKSPLYVEPYSNFTGLEGSRIDESSIGDIDSMQQDNPLYEERELRMDMFELSDDETEGDFDDENLLAEALREDDTGSGSVTAI